MKITGYRIEHYSVQMDRPIADANAPTGEDLMPMSLLFIDSDNGLTGIAPGGNDAVGSLFHLVEGEDPRGVVGLWMKMNDYVHKGGNEGTINSALSAIDVALWDLKAKSANEPLWQTLGALEGRTKAYASGIDYCLTDEELYQFYSRMADLGIDGGKLKLGLDQTADRRRLGIMRDALSTVTSRPQLMIDSNEYWSPKQAVRYITELEKEFDLTWVEEPARRWDYAGLNLVSRQVAAAVATGENLNSVADFYPLVANQAVDILNISSGHSGITGCRQVANLAYAYELPVTMMNCPANYMAHLAAALPNHISMEVVDPGREHAMQYTHYIEDGYIHLSDKPGLGLDIDMDALSTIQAAPPARASKFPFSRRQGAGRFIVPPQNDEVPWI